MSPTKCLFSKLAWTGSMLLAVATGGRIASSLNGVDWSEESVGSHSTVAGLATGAGRLVAVCTDGTVLTSPGGAAFRSPASSTGGGGCAASPTGGAGTATLVFLAVLLAISVLRGRRPRRQLEA